MAKKRKTRQEKKLADLRHNFTYNLVTSTPSTSNELKLKIEPNKLVKKSPIRKETVSVSAYPYLAKDLSKTGILTAGILAFQIVLFFLVKNHTIAIPGLNY